MSKLAWLLVVSLVLILVYPYLWNSGFLVSFVPTGIEEPPIKVLNPSYTEYITYSSATAKIGIDSKASIVTRMPYLFGLSYLPLQINKTNLRNIHNGFFYSMVFLIIVSIIGIIYDLRKNKEVKKNEYEKWY